MASISITPIVAVIATIGLLFPYSSLAAIPSNAAAPYIEGLDALNEGRWPDAVTAFTRAFHAASDDPDIVLARGVANTLAEDFPGAQKDLDRAQRLGQKDREPLLWIWATEAMSGLIVVPDHAVGGGPRSLRSDRPVVVSIPGHVA